MMVSKTLFSNNSDEWSTPQNFFDEINKEFKFDLDPCATIDNHKCENFFTIEDDGLKKNWGGAECFAIHHIVKYLYGLRKHFMKQETRIH